MIHSIRAGSPPAWRRWAAASPMALCAALSLTACGGDYTVNPSPIPAACDKELQDDEHGVIDSLYDQDGDGAFDATYCEGVYPDDRLDCDDRDADIHPGADETCDGADQDCDGLVDEGASDATTFYVDEDDDGYGTDASAVTACQAPDGYASQLGDCDDADDTKHPGAEERCNNEDDDCDGQQDEDNPTLGAPEWWHDIDHDGYGEEGYSLGPNCEPPPDASTSGGDCQDNDETIYPGAAEACDGLDQDCDSVVDEGALSTFYSDSDGDGFGDEAILACAAPEGAVEEGGDCDDGDLAVYPGAEEVCDLADDDCDGATDEGFDADGDGVSVCGGDCDDTDDDVFPGAAETCATGEDRNCDGILGPGGLQCTIPLGGAPDREDLTVIRIDTTTPCDGGGMGVVAPGDVDEDGEGDVVLGAPYVRVNGSVSVGVVHLVTGDELSPFYPGEGEGAPHRVLSVGRSATLDRGVTRTYQGGAMAPMTGVDGGGSYESLAVGRLTRSLADNSRDTLASFPARLLDAEGDTELPETHVLADCYASAQDLFGAALASADLDGDGALDLVVGIPEADAEETDGVEQGQVQVLFGPIPLNMGCTTEEPDVRTVFIDTLPAEVHLGTAVGTLTLGSRTLVTASAPFDGTTGRVYVMDIPRPAPDTNDYRVVGEGLADVLILGPAQSYIGHSLADAGDVDGDGYGDLLIGASYNSADNGAGYAAFLVFGDASWLSGEPVTIDLGDPEEPARFIAFRGGSIFDLPNNRERQTSPLSPDGRNLLGFTVAGVGDVDGGGRPDLLLGYDASDDLDLVDAGRAYLFYGEADGALASHGGADHDRRLDLTDAEAIFLGGEDLEGVGLQVAPAGDLNGDGFSDLLLGTWRGRLNTGTSCDDDGVPGRAYVVLGQARALPEEN